MGTEMPSGWRRVFPRGGSLFLGPAGRHRLFWDRDSLLAGSAAWIPGSAGIPESRPPSLKRRPGQSERKVSLPLKIKLAAAALGLAGVKREGPVRDENLGHPLGLRRLGLGAYFIFRSTRLARLWGPARWFHFQPAIELRANRLHVGWERVSGSGGGEWREQNSGILPRAGYFQI